MEYEAVGEWTFEGSLEIIVEADGDPTRYPSGCV